ncbi:class II fructose-bisphosphate aldolase [Alicyclobacillus dauci]|uniref:Class II fructose-bisphosphate aldolase n=1 Tax=Alicyclobacillus dauci TaxID=1475485 RepID=A0ABY6Z6L0_9BACL|nr:class II fructose-bisphosphate aldolase [Alicyclobacillus dauci]WAH38380.1 class II fructose-bisphosphate aldolase [Alicyclobacillus dauci]
MPLYTGTILKRAYEERYAVPAFSVHNYAMIEAVVEEARELQVPVLIQIGQRAIRYGQMRSLQNHIALQAAVSPYPVVSHLDHCHDFEQIIEALRAGLTSCMIDASMRTLDENILLTRKVVEACHAVGVPVEGELGAIGGVEDDVSVADDEVVFTAPDVAERYVRETGVDSLAVAIGSAHGMYKREPSLDLDRLAAINRHCGIPLVLHGGSGIPRWQIQKAIQFGISKINFDTELRLAYLEGLKSGCERHSDDPFQAEQIAKERLREVIREKIHWSFPGGLVQR